MKTTLALDDELIAELKQRAHDSGRSFTEVVNETLRAGLERMETPPASRAYSVPAVGLGSPRPGRDLYKALAMAGSLEWVNPASGSSLQ